MIAKGEAGPVQRIVLLCKRPGDEGVPASGFVSMTCTGCGVELACTPKAAETVAPEADAIICIVCVAKGADWVAKNAKRTK